jgi:hypothetical protein
VTVERSLATFAVDPPNFLRNLCEMVEVQWRFRNGRDSAVDPAASEPSDAQP